MVRLRLLLLIMTVTISACGSDQINLDSVVPASGYEVGFVVGDLKGPTQFTVLNEQRVVVAILNGDENDMQGQVLDIRLDEGTRLVIEDELDKPTGLAVVGQDLWIMERNRLVVSPDEFRIVGDLAKRRPLVVLDDLPNNSRSEGTLTVTPEKQLLFNTSGSKRGSEVVAGSGRLFTLETDDIRVRVFEDDVEPVEIASGFKHAYAHAYDGDVLWTVEMSDGTFDGKPAADEIVAVVRGADHGWPHCVENNRAVIEFGGTSEVCDQAPTSLTTFEPSASPTSIVVSPFEPNTLLVALWNEGRIVAVDTTSANPTSYVDVVTGLNRPQHLVVVGDSVFVSEFGEDRILQLTS